MAGTHGGILTFLLSDIEGSAARWDRDDVAMAAALERHDRLLRTILEGHGGRWVKHTGDGALVVFASTLAAVAGSVAAQRAMAEADWADVGGLRARMALHTGEAQHRDDDVFGQALNRTARLLDLAHGGQVLLSLATEELVRDRLPDGTSLRDLGSHRLPDLGHHEQIFQLEAPGLGKDFPPLRGQRDARIALPEFRTSFVGRERDLDVLSSTLEQHRLVTLTGVGGSGKTRLAVELGRAVARRFPDGLFFVDLAAIVDEELVPRETAQAVGVVTGGVVGPAAEPIREQLLRAIRDRRMLIVLDNCEHLLDACADHVEELLKASEDLRVLATSREALALEGEQTWPVTSLTVPRGDDDDAAAMQLLLDRMREIRPDLVVEDEDRLRLAEICRRLDGLPLALELAAARLAHLSPADVADRLDDRFRLLAGGRRRTERQQTLRATIDWSYDLLDEPEQVLLRRLSVFAGGAPLDAVVAIAMEGLEAELAVDLLGRLVARSLVVADTSKTTTRYRLLETIRLYGEEKLLAAGEAETVRRAHRDWYVSWLEATPWDRRLVSPVIAELIQPEFDNLRLTLEWSAAQGEFDAVVRLVCALSGFGILNGYADELDRWRNLAHEAELSDLALAELDAHCGYMDCWRYNGDPRSFEALRELASRASEVLPRDHRYFPLARCIFAASHTVTHPREPWRIEEPAAEAASIAEEMSLPWLRIMAMSFVARARLLAQDAAGARAVMLEAMSSDAWRDEDDGHCLRHDLAVALHLLGDQTEALENARLVHELGPRAWQHFGLLDMAVVTAALGDTATARHHVREFLAHLEVLRSRHPLAMNDCAMGLAAVATHEGRWRDAAQLIATTGGHMSHPSLYALLLHYRDRIRDALPRPERHDAIAEGAGIDPRTAVEEELSRDR